MTGPVARLASLGSGSRGNGTLVDLGGELVLVDCGFTRKQAEARLARLGVRPADLSAILVTHEHSDHVGGVPALAHRYAVPVFSSHGTRRSAGNGLVAQCFDSHRPFQIGRVTVEPVIVPHDAREPTQFVFAADGLRIGVVSDLGRVTPFVAERYQGCDALLMEANYDPELLQNGPYPEAVKRRIASPLGHLSNRQAADLLDRVAHPAAQVVVGHVSEQNNHPERLAESFAPFFDRVASLTFATQDHGADWLAVESAGNAAVEGRECAAATT